MDLLGMKACIVPPNPGNLSAFGLLAVDWRTDHIVTKVMHEDAVDLAAVAGIYTGLEREAARRWSATASSARASGSCARPTCATPASRWRCACRRRAAIDGPFVAALIAAFHAAHLKTFGYNYAGQQKIELVNFCVSGFGLIERPALPKLASGGDAGTQVGRRSISTARSRDAGLRPRALPPASGSTGRPWSRSSARPPWSFPASSSTVDPHGC